ncbi:DUF4286 family protein [Chloroflexota bacterium]
MEKWVNLIEAACADPSREDEWNDWYDNVHIPDVLETPGFVAGTRYKTEKPKEGRGPYLCIYEIETDDIDDTMALRLATREKERNQGRYKDDLTVRIQRDILYRQIRPRQTRT